jgi:ParB-like chromosome segregation protein Spo0J
MSQTSDRPQDRTLFSNQTPELVFHTFAEIFPPMEGEPFERLVADIAAHGLREPITVDPDGLGLDGRNRYRACQQAGVKIHTRVFKGSEAETLAFIVSANLHRRHLNESQRAMVAARLATLQLGANQHAQECAPSQEQAAQTLNVSRRLVQDARKVQERGTPEEIAAVQAGDATVSATVRAVRAREQAQEASEPPLSSASQRKQRLVETRFEAAMGYLTLLTQFGDIALPPLSPERAEEVLTGLQKAIDSVTGLMARIRSQ